LTLDRTKTEFAPVPRLPIKAPELVQGLAIIILAEIRKEIMPDFVHPSTAGHQIWADAITPKLTELMK
jgi:lysophospholipase L1-like esterase